MVVVAITGLPAVRQVLLGVSTPCSERRYGPTLYAVNCFLWVMTKTGLPCQVEELILSELEKLKKSGFTSTAVEAALNSIEFDLRENNTGSFPRGLSLMLRSMSTWIYDKDPFQPLQWTDALAHFKVCRLALDIYVGLDVSTNIQMDKYVCRLIFLVSSIHVSTPTFASSTHSLSLFAGHLKTSFVTRML